ncbi:MAG TPA: MlaD family protein [Actinomycetota bacterium]|nr:MlaD family protein [Actinomycetota bacterium]
MKRLALALVALSLGIAGCTNAGNTIPVVARFDDVGDLFDMAPVMFADIKVGEVTDVTLSGGRALVSMDIDRAAEVPANVIARVRRTSVLGERIIDLVVPESGPSTESLTGGATIEETEIRADLEDLVVEGTDVFGEIAAGELATMIEAGAEGFGGRGDELGQILVNFRDITKSYSKETKRISNLIDSLNEFNSIVGTRTEAHKAALRNTARAVEVLDEESVKLERALKSLARLAMSSRDVLDAHVDEMDRFFDQARAIVGTLKRRQTSIARFLLYAPRHNRNTQLVEYRDFNQIFQDFVICGLNDNPDDPARRCIGDDD